MAIKLISGEEIIGRLLPDDTSASGLALRKPYLVAVSPTGLSMAPFMPYADEKALESVLFSAQSIVTGVAVNQALADAYNERTGGIAVARSQIITK